MAIIREGRLQPPKQRPAVQRWDTEATPEEAGYCAERLDVLDNLYLDLIMEGKILCADYMMSRNGKVFACRSMGRLTYHEDSPDFTPDSIRWIASLTKTFATVSIMKLIEDGKLYLDQPVATILKEFDTDMHRKIKLFHLLTHTSGIRADQGYFNEPYLTPWWGQSVMAKIKAGRADEANWIKEILAGPLQNVPGEQWNYCSSGYLIVGEIISRVSGVHCEQYILDNICKPLGLKDTVFDLPEEAISRAAITDENEERYIKRLEKDEFEEQYKSMGPPRTSGALNSTVRDMHRFGSMLLNKGTYDGVRIMGRKAVEAMTRKQLENVPAYFWGAEFKDMPMGLGVYMQTPDILTPGTFNNEGAGYSLMYIDPAESFVFNSCTPHNLGFVPETVHNVRPMVWSGII